MWCAAWAWEACCTLACSRKTRPTRFADAGLTAYNHNLDTSPEFWSIITTLYFYDASVRRRRVRVREVGHQHLLRRHHRAYEDRRVRYGLLKQLSSLDPHPESVPVNMLVKVDGTPLDDVAPEDPLELVRTIATARILMPRSMVRLSAGRMR